MLFIRKLNHPIIETHLYIFYTFNKLMCYIMFRCRNYHYLLLLLVYTHFCIVPNEELISLIIVL